MSIGENIQRLRERAGESRPEFANRIGITRGHQYDLEVGNKTPSLDMLERIARGLTKALGQDVTVPELLIDNGRQRKSKRRELVGGKR